jgi:hypothetical protein
MARANEAEVLRAAKLSRVPGVTLDQACARYDVPRSAVQRARKGLALPLAELAVAAVTENGTRTRGTLDLAATARWLDYVNHDGCTAAEVARLLATVPELLAIDGKRWRLRAPWP